MPTKEEIWEKVQELGEALGVAAESLWSIFVRQEFAVNGILHGLFGAAALYGSYRLVVFGFALSGPWAVVAPVLGVPMFLLGLVWFKAGASRALNPAYYVLRNIGQMFHIGEK